MCADELNFREKIQEKQYCFPYHYLVSWNNGVFTQTKAMAKGYEYVSYIRFIIDKIKEYNFNSLLDIGCGDGKFLNEIGSLYQAGKQFVGLDYSKQAIDLACAMTQNANISYICTNIAHNTVSANGFDIITLIETLEHIHPDDIAQFLKGINAHLHDEGHLFITVPCKNEDVRFSPKHYQHFDISSLHDILSPFFSICEYHFINRKSMIEQKILKKLFYNNYFIINHKDFVRILYKYYLKHFFYANEQDAKRIVIVCRKIRKIN